MIRVTVELVRYGLEKPRVIGMMIIANDLEDSLNTGGARGSYRYKILGRRGRRMHDGRVVNWPRRSKHVWALVARCLKEAGYS